MGQRPLPWQRIAVGLAAAATIVLVKTGRTAKSASFEGTMRRNSTGDGAAIGNALGQIGGANWTAIHKNIERAAEKATESVGSAATTSGIAVKRKSETAAGTASKPNKPTFAPTAEPTTSAEYDGCCFMASHDVWPGPKNDVNCGGVCYTRRACNGTSYPFRSREEMERFKPWTPSAEQRGALKERCDALMETTPEARWCRNGGGIDLDRIPMGCSTVNGYIGRSGPFDRMMLFPEGRLAFCGLPKAGITQWTQFRRFVSGARDYQSLPHFKHDTLAFRFDALDPERQSLILKDPNWTKAIIVRNPAERLLSAYLDKVQNSGSKIFPSFPRDNITFAEFVDMIETPNATCTKGVDVRQLARGLTWCMDPHWRPQAWSCGLTELLPHFALVGDLNRTAQHTRQLLEKVGLWDRYGKQYRTSTREEAYARGGNICKSRPPPPLEPGGVAVGFQQAGQADVYGHSKGSQSMMDRYYSEELLSRVRKLYAVDYALWDALQSFDGERAPSGEELARRLNPSCSLQ